MLTTDRNPALNDRQREVLAFDRRVAMIYFSSGNSPWSGPRARDIGTVAVMLHGFEGFYNLF